MIVLSNLKVAKDPVLSAAEEWRGNGRAITLGLSRSASIGGRVFAELTAGERGLSRRSVGYSAGRWCIYMGDNGLDHRGGLRLLRLVTSGGLFLGPRSIESLINSRSSRRCRHSIRRCLALGDK